MRDWKGRTLSGVTVAVDRAPGRVETFRSAADGAFGPVAVAFGPSISWKAAAPDHPLARGTWDPGAEPDPLLVEMAAPAFVEGLVVDAYRRPLADAKVFEADGVPGVEVRTAADGSFRWPVAVGRWADLNAVHGARCGWCRTYAGVPTRILVRRNGSLREPTTASPPAPVAPEKSFPTVRLGVLATDESGEPLAGACVAFHDRADRRVEEYTGPDGRCEVDARSDEVDVLASYLGAGESFVHLHEIPASREWHVTVPRGPFSRDPPSLEEPTPWDFMARVVDAEGEPVADGDYDVEPGSAYGWPNPRGELRVVLPGTESLEATVSVEGYLPVRARLSRGTCTTVRLPPRGVLHVDLVDRPRADEEVQEGYDPNPPEPPEMLLWTSDRLDRPYDALEFWGLDLGSEVRYVLPVGRHTIAFRIAPGGWALFRDVVVPERGEVRLRYSFPSWGRLRGTVRAATGDLVADADVLLAATGLQVYRSDDRGNLVLDMDFAVGRLDVIVGRERLLVRADGFAPVVTEPVDLSQDGYLDVVLPAGGQVAGTLVSKDGTPVLGTVAWLPPFGAPAFETRTDHEGNFTLDDALPLGTQRLRITAGERERDVEVEVVADAAKNRFRIEAP